MVKFKASRKERQNRNAKRFGVLYQKYLPSVWWWELLELTRKLLLVGLLTFVADNSTTQIFFALLITVLALVLSVHYHPYMRGSMDLLLSVSQACTFLTLVAALGLKTGIANEGVVDEGFLGWLLVFLQVAPMCVVAALLCHSVKPAHRKRVQKRVKRSRRPAVVLDESPEEQLRRLRQLKWYAWFYSSSMTSSAGSGRMSLGNRGRLGILRKQQRDAENDRAASVSVASTTSDASGESTPRRHSQWRHHVPEVCTAHRRSTHAERNHHASPFEQQG
eukprot:5342779-Prymnesium_polylepis.1